MVRIREFTALILLPFLMPLYMLSEAMEAACDNVYVLVVG
jgi:hypothetical protein